MNTFSTAGSGPPAPTVDESTHTCEGAAYSDDALYPSALVPEVPTEPLSEAELLDVPLGRNKFMRRVAALVFGGAITSAVLASDALAACPTSPPPMCSPSPRCCCCNASGCCVGGCTRRYGCSGHSCNCGWFACYGGQRYFCTDWWQGTGSTNPCICQILTMDCTYCC